jgi:hypothetical protein
VPFILGFSRTAPIRACLAALSGQQRRWVRDGGAIRLGTCPWDARLHPNRIAVGFRLLARNPAIGLQLATAEQSPSPSVNAARSAPLTSMASAPSWSKVARSLFARSARRPLSSSTSAGPTAWSTSRLEFKLPDLR